ncbi:MAG: endolytic transglycosylase MltG [Candidatus Pristimantibacillus lignocellulolyticus]|uniref:Endolytic murein transglycosylase n=1 Tax=Candidatus Pristimantibacillus lignocellulolyticus TaxID=2994561 RepID=A0A9J6ZAI9_9BACL|nr:MAG: endolytic transglycosylase MltG [Candidatus Pristimantibacillus lignocellulolyticus]
MENEEKSIEEKSTEEKKKQPKRKRIKPKKWVVSFWVFFGLLFFMVLVAASGLFYLWSQLEPTKSGSAIEVTIPKGSSANSVAKVLEENGIIKNGFIFGYYLVLKDEGDNFKAGKYELAPGMDKAEVIAKLNAGDVIAQETVTFTIPEGFTIAQMADKLSTEGLVDKDKFISLTKESHSWSGAENVLNVPQETTELINRLEGYLFPDTYEVVKGSTEEDIIMRMLKEQDRKLATLPEDWPEELEKLGLSMHELLTIASLIEREVVVDSERATVAGVIYNRLKEPMRLQIDATIQYALGEQKELLSIEDTKLDSPYNTYVIDGIPPGPIATPSLESIKAALYPEEHKFYYYVTKKDGTQTHLFAETYNQHLRNIDKSKETAQ